MACRKKYGNKGDSALDQPLQNATDSNKGDFTLDQSLQNATDIVTKCYLEHLERYKIVPPFEEDIDINIVQCGTFYKLSKLVVNREENFLDKLTTIVNVASSIRCSIATIIKSDGYRIEYYFGIISKQVRDSSDNSAKRRAANAIAFQGALTGNLTGSELEELTETQIIELKNDVLAKEDSYYAAISGVVALRDEKQNNIEGYVQGIENLVDSLKGLKYTIVMLADPVGTSEIQVMKQGYEMIHTQLSTFARSSVTMNESDTDSLSKARTDGISEGISKGIAMTQSKTKSTGNYFGGSASIGANFIVSASVGFNAGVNSSSSDTKGSTNTSTEFRQDSSSITRTTASSKTTGKSLQLSYENRSVKSLLDNIDRQLERLDKCGSFGAFDCATYVIADTREIAISVAGNYNALMRGKNSNIQSAHINCWYEQKDREIFRKYLSSLVHPNFKKNEKDSLMVTPASIISGEELAIQVGLPKKSISGVTVLPMAAFGRNIPNSLDRTIEIGNLYHMGHNDGNSQKVRLDIESLSMHTFVTGSTGRGKTTAIYTILEQLMNRNVKYSNETIKFLVIEPAKGEYKDHFGNNKSVSIYGTNETKTPLLRLNPFSFPQEVHVLEHIDRLIEIFNVCWPMYAAMPAILKDAVERAYQVSGWDLNQSYCKYKDSTGTPLFPTFLDVLNQINIVLDQSMYSSESKGDYKGALCTRIKSLTNGLYGQIFSSDELSQEKLFNENVIIDLSRVGSSETKALIMGLLVMKLQEYRMATENSSNSPLKHVTVLEEAHNILKRTSINSSADSGAMVEKSVEMLANSIAEMRTYGEGFIIADQSPDLLDRSVIRNTNTKLIFGLPDLEDRQLVGRASGLNDDQIVELSRLKTFVASIYQNNWLEPVLCNMNPVYKNFGGYCYTQVVSKKKDYKKVIEYMLLPLKHRNRLERGYVDSLRDTVYQLPIPSEVKVAFTKYTNTTEIKEIQLLRERIIYKIFNSEIALECSKEKSSNIESWYTAMKDVLEPSIMLFDEKEQQKIIALIIKEKAQLDGIGESKELFERFMMHI